MSAAMISSCLTYTNEDGDTLVIIYASILGLRIERGSGRGKSAPVSLQFLLATGLEEINVSDEIARKMLDGMGLSAVPLPQVDEES